MPGVKELSSHSSHSRPAFLVPSTTQEPSRLSNIQFGIASLFFLIVEQIFRFVNLSSGNFLKDLFVRGSRKFSFQIRLAE